MIKRSTNLVIISGPSGSGHDSVIEGLVKRGLPIERVITTVTRPPRTTESQGKPYYFVPAEEFERLITNDKMAEWATVYGNKYGAAREELARVKSKGDKIGIWKMEWHGVAAAKKLFPDILAIMIVPPDIQTLIEHSEKRGQQGEEEIQTRLAFSKEMLEHKELYDYVVANEEGKLEATVDKVVDILKQQGYIG